MHSAVAGTRTQKKKHANPGLGKHNPEPTSGIGSHLSSRNPHQSHLEYMYSPAYPRRLVPRTMGDTR